ncbi:MAG: HU family DNA-binding protein [Nitrosarchaeum sp.]
MNKAELIAAIAKDNDMSKAEAGRALESVLSNISKGMKKSNVQLVGFGTFKIVKRKARKGVNPSTGEKIKIPAKKVVQFKASKNPKY